MKLHYFSADTNLIRFKTFDSTFSAHKICELKTHLFRQKCAKTHVRQSGIPKFFRGVPRLRRGGEGKGRKPRRGTPNAGSDDGRGKTRVHSHFKHWVVRRHFDEAMALGSSRVKWEKPRQLSERSRR